MLDGLLCFEYGDLEKCAAELIAACKRLERDKVDVPSAEKIEKMLMVAVTKCDLLPEITTVCFGKVLEKLGVDYIFTSSKSWDVKNSGEKFVGVVNPICIMKIIGRKMLEHHLNFCLDS